jgi:hypothetical protein
MWIRLTFLLSGTLKRALHSLSCPFARRSNFVESILIVTTYRHYSTLDYSSLLRIATTPHYYEFRLLIPATHHAHCSTFSLYELIVWFLAWIRPVMHVTEATLQKYLEACRLRVEKHLRLYPNDLTMVPTIPPTTEFAAYTRSHLDCKVYGTSR